MGFGSPFLLIMMIDIYAIVAILLLFIFLIYEKLSFGKLKGEIILKIRLQKQLQLEAKILVFAMVIFILTYPLQYALSYKTIFLLTIVLLLITYMALIRFPHLVLKKEFFIFGNVFFRYENITAINQTAEGFLVIDLKSSRRLVVKILDKTDLEKVVQFFGGYK